MSKKINARDQGKMANLIEYRMRVTLVDGRQLSGQMLAFDKHMNLVLDDTEEFRITRKKGKAAGGEAAIIENEQKRVLGLIILRGAQVVSCSVEGPPPDDPAKRLGNSAPTISAGPGISKPAGRGVPIGLGGPAAGVGGPSPYGFGPGQGRFPAGFPGAPPGAFPGRGGPLPFAQVPPGFPPQGFQGPPGPPQGGRGFPPPGFGR